MLRHLAPAGAPIHAVDLARWTLATASPRDVSMLLRQGVEAQFGVRHSVITSTGRAGLTLLLRALRRLSASRRDEVILPSYTCYSVAASVVKAGLRPRLVDVSPDTLDYRPDLLARADFSQVLGIVATNLYGIPNDLPALAAIARAHGAFLVDDAAQAMGATVAGRKSGTWGDAGLFSFDKGKNVSAIDGGLLVTSSSEIAQELERETATLASPSVAASGLDVLKAVAYFTLLRPWLYWIPQRIPQLGLGKTCFSMDFPIARPSRALVALALTMMKRLEEFNEARRTNAQALLAGLEGVPGVKPIAVADRTSPVYLRFPVLIDDLQARDRLFKRLSAEGIGASGSYPASLADVPELQRALAGRTDPIGGRYVAGHIVTLPTHAFVRPQDVSRTVDIIADTTNVRRAGARCQEKSAVCAE